MAGSDQLNLSCKVQKLASRSLAVAGSLAVANRVKASFLRRSRSHDLGSTRTLAMLLRPWIRRSTMIVSA